MPDTVVPLNIGSAICPVVTSPDNPDGYTTEIVDPLCVVTVPVTFEYPVRR